ncbi:MAG: aldehyde dehydrogenase [Actinomycetota bacterium]|jgi:aldehyde dehydrogenase (NAD+)
MAISVLPQRDELGVKDGQLYIDGRWQDASDGATWTHHHPASGEEIGRFAVASAADVSAAVGAARRAFDDGAWTSMRAGDRRRLLQRAARLFGEHYDELLRLQTLDNGLPLSMSKLTWLLTPEFMVEAFEHHAGWIDKLTGETYPPYEGGDHLLMTLREPVGVVGAIIPWNAPLMLMAQKVAPALAAGCTVVLKPSEFASFCVIRAVQLLEEAGLPPGVLNLVTGPGDPTGEALITDDRVDKVSFTGSRAVGSRIMTAAASRIGGVALELGGKSPTLVFPDAPDLGLAAMTAMGMVSMGLSGQGCVVHSRVLVHESVYDSFLDSAAALTGMVTYGNPFDESTTSAALINDKQLARVTGYIAAGLDAGARLVCGGDRPGGELQGGNFVNPTLFADVDNSMSIAQDEIFGPVLSVLPFSTEEQGIRIANDTTYGLGASVYTSDIKRAFRVAKAVRAGTFGINGYNVEPHAPFGGVKQSGLGREGGRHGIEEFTELKTIIAPLD